MLPLTRRAVGPAQIIRSPQEGITPLRRIALVLGAAAVAIGGGSAIAQSGAEDEAITTLVAAPMPKLTGLSLDKARSALQAAGIHYDLEQENTATAKAGTPPNTVLEQDPPAGDEVESGLGDLEPVLVKVYVPKAGAVTGQNPAAIAACKAITNVVKGGSADIGLKLLSQTGSKKPKLDYSPTAAATVPTLQSVDRAKGKCGGSAKVQVSNALQQQDLYFVLQPRKRRPTLAPFKVGDKTQLELVAGQANFFTIDVMSRSTGKRQTNATIDLDGSDVGGKDVRGKMGSKGKTGLKITPKRGGSFDVVATAPTAGGQTLYGVAKIAVRTPAQAGSSYRTARGDLFVKKGNVYKFSRAPLAKKSQAGDETGSNESEVLTDAQVCAGLEALSGTGCGEGGIPVGVARDSLAVSVFDSDSPVTQDPVVATTQTRDVLVQQPGASDALGTSGPVLDGYAPIAADGTISAPAKASLVVTIVGAYKNPVTYNIPAVFVTWFKTHYEKWARDLAAKYGLKIPSIDPNGKYTIYANRYPFSLKVTKGRQATEDTTPPGLAVIGSQDVSTAVAVDYQETEGACGDFGQWATAPEDGEANVVGGLGQRACQP